MGDSGNRSVGPVLPIIATIVWLAFMVIVAFIGLFSVMIFDSGDVSVWSWLLFIGIWAFVILCPISILAGWLSWALTRASGRGRALRTSAYLLPLLGVLVFAVGFVGTDVLCSGSLTC